ncbi:MAG: hypothetical protein K5928_06260 [Prevotella sp.]|nr:hypothetical protein [Prevotella sp.]
MAKANTNNVSIANVISMLGLAGVAVITFFGILLGSADGAIGTAALLAAALAAVLACLLVVSMKAKAADDNRDKWRIVEIATLAAYIAVALMFSTPLHRFFYVKSQQQQLQQQARQEISDIQQLYADYEQQRKAALDNAVQQMTNYQNSKTKSMSMDAYIQKMHVDEKWAAKADKLTKLRSDAELKQLAQSVEDFKLLSLAQTAARLAEKDSTAYLDVMQKIQANQAEHDLIPRFVNDAAGAYTQDGFAQINIQRAPQPRLQPALQKASGSTAISWIVMVVLHMLILFSYVVTRHSDIVGPSQKNGPKGGLDL